MQHACVTSNPPVILVLRSRPVVDPVDDVVVLDSVLPLHVPHRCSVTAQRTSQGDSPLEPPTRLLMYLFQLIGGELEG